jgi:hypothetical protein
VDDDLTAPIHLPRHLCAAGRTRGHKVPDLRTRDVFRRAVGRRMLGTEGPGKIATRS